MRNFLLGVSLCVCVTLAVLLLQSEKPVAAGGNIDPKGTLGFVYGVPNVDQWRKSFASGGNENSQAQLDKQLTDKTHYVYEQGTSESQNRMAFQRMMWLACKEGWTVISTDEKTLSAIMSNPSVKINDMALKPTKR